MKILKRTLYLFYYIKNIDIKQFMTYYRYVQLQTGWRGVKLLWDIFRSVYRYNISIKDYFLFRFFSADDDERSSWAGTGFMYEYQLKMNPGSTRKVLEDKILFLEAYAPFIHRKHASLDDLMKQPELLHSLLKDAGGRLVLKASHGQVGAEVEVISSDDFDAESLIRHMQNKGYNLVEAFVQQHPLLQELSPSGLNTIRVFTQLHENKIIILGHRLRISVNSQVDNMGAGNLAAPVDNETGVVSGPGVYSDITKSACHTHPVTGIAIEGFSIPYWDEVINLAKKAATHRPENRSVGWDIAVTANGPELIEGNHNWCKILWQLPVKRGLKAEIEKYITWKNS